MKTLRLVVTYDCIRDYAMCCNKLDDYPPEKVKSVNENFLPQALESYDEIVVTGGEPVMFHSKLIELSKQINLAGCIKSYVNTAMTSIDIDEFNSLCAHFDGVTMTIHDQDALEEFFALVVQINCSWAMHWLYQDTSLRVNIFKDICMSSNDWSLISRFWDVKKDYVWKNYCSLPKHETLLKLEDLWKTK